VFLCCVWCWVCAHRCEEEEDEVDWDHTNDVLYFDVIQRN
jgi:hypothetical protein